MSKSTKRKPRGDQNRRRRAHTLVNFANIKALCKGFGVTAWSVKAIYHVLAEHSDNLAKPVYGHQKTFADEAECSVRHFRRCIRVLEKAGLITVRRYEAERMADGKWARQSVNWYQFVVPKGKPNRKKSRSNVAANADLYKPQLTVAIETLGEISIEKGFDPRLDGPDPWSVPPPGGFSELRQRLWSVNA